MNRKEFIKLMMAVSTAAVVVPPPEDLLAQTGGHRSYDSKTISVQLVEEVQGLTSVRLTEHGDANYAIVEAFYYTMMKLEGKDVRVMLSKEATTPLAKNFTFGTELVMPLSSIEFIRVKEVKVLTQSELVTGQRSEGRF